MSQLTIQLIYSF